MSVGHFPVAPFNRAAHSDDVHPVPLVVVIDDEAPVGEVAGYVLAMHGFEVKVATSGATGLQLVRETLPDAVVCDVRMPDFTGEQVVLALRAMKAATASSRKKCKCVNHEKNETDEREIVSCQVSLCFSISSFRLFRSFLV